MANPVCTVASLSSGAVCYKNYEMSERFAIMVYYMAAELAANGGTSYTIGSGGTLEDASVCYKNLTYQEYCVPSVYMLLIAYNNAVSAGASVAAGGSEELATAIQCNKNFPPGDHAAQILFLTCALGRHADYPQ